ncbi:MULTISPECIES: nucleotidyltransferase family protein [unclassified Micromonospora]|uniref:nucleotidyltransferase family protein n=1 Tax=unclassified Micromonospora TaxID=2617518 RepID=UPI00143DE485|nr:MULTISPECIES: nucleotidyltransferase family protein [unclassified Micromonospora]
MTAPRATSVAVRHLALDAAAVATSARLADRGVPAVLLKGAGLARRLGTEGSRVYSDVDLLVAPDDYDQAGRILTTAGFRSALPPGRPDPRLLWHERPWHAPGPVPLVVDLHRGFHGVGDPQAFWTLLSASAESLPLAGGTVAVPDVAATALLVALHAAAPGRSGRPYADLLRALRVFPVEVWRAAAVLAGQTDAVPAFGFGLRLAPGGAELADRLGLPRRTSRTQWAAVRRVSGPAYVLARLAELPAGRDRWRHLVPYLLPPPTAMRHGSRLARRGPVGLLAAYLLRFARQVASLPTAVRELRTATRLARRSGHG